ncbi:MAG: hypothetical protein ACYC64_01515 [Armatimonadota bacterium]
MNHNRAVFSTIICVAIMLTGIQVGVWAQTVTNTAQVLTISNQYIQFGLGTAGQYGSGTSTSEVAGRYTVMAGVGDPETATDDSKPLIFGAPIPMGNFGYWKIKVGDKTPVLIGAGSGGSGGWLASNKPASYTAPMPGLGRGIGGPYIEGEWITADATPVGLKLHISLVRDQVRFEMTVINRGTSTQSIGLGMYGDYMVTDTCTGESPFIPGVGFARTSGVQDQFPGTILSGTKISSLLEAYDSLEDPARVARNTLSGQDCTVPDYVAIGEFSELSPVGVWLPDGFKPNPMVGVDDVSFLLQWKQVALAPGASRKYVTYYGIGAATSLWTYKSGTKTLQDSVVAAVQGPRSLKFDSVSSATKVSSDAADDLSPNPFKISAYVYNTATDPGPYGLESVTAYLYLPDGLQLANVSDSAQLEIGDVPINSESSVVTWQVEPTGEYSGELQYFVAFRDNKGWQQLVGRKILVPAAKKTVMRYGYQLMSVPFGFNDPTIDHVFGLTSGSYRALYYDAIGTQNYVPLSQSQPGQAFWMAIYDMSSGSKRSYELATDATVVGEQYGQQFNEQYVEVQSGWNMVGNPFVYPVYVGQIMVYDKSTNITYSFDEAVKKGWISRTIYSWNQDRYAYDTMSTNDAMLKPWNGYWVRAKTPVTLVFRPTMFPGSGVSCLAGGY